MSKSCLIAKDWNTRTLPADPTLLKLAADARANYEKRLKTIQDEEHAKKKSELEKKLMQEVAAAKAQSSKIQQLCVSATATEEELKKKLEEKMHVGSLLEELHLKAKQADEDLEQLRKKKEQIQKRKHTESTKIAEKVLKEHAKALTSHDGPHSCKRQKLL